MGYPSANVFLRPQAGESGVRSSQHHHRWVQGGPGVVQGAAGNIFYKWKEAHKLGPGHDETTERPRCSTESYGGRLMVWSMKRIRHTGRSFLVTSSLTDKVSSQLCLSESSQHWSSWTGTLRSAPQSRLPTERSWQGRSTWLPTDRNCSSTRRKSSDGRRARRTGPRSVEAPGRVGCRPPQLSQQIPMADGDAR